MEDLVIIADVEGHNAAFIKSVLEVHGIPERIIRQQIPERIIRQHYLILKKPLRGRVQQKLLFIVQTLQQA
jgi:hypothetical protein